MNRIKSLIIRTLLFWLAICINTVSPVYLEYAMRSVCAFLLTFSCSTLWPAAIVIDDLQREWSRVRPNTVSVSGDRIEWGTPQGYGPSAYEFLPNIYAPTSVEEGELFEIGRIRHHNNDVDGSTLAKGNFEFSLDVSIDGQIWQDNLFEFRFDFWENWDSGVQARTEIVEQPQWEIMFVDDVDYLLKVHGFQVDGAAVTSWYTPENSTTDVVLLGSVSRVVIPEPSTYLALGCLLILALLLSRRSKTRLASQAFIEKP